jgi:single-strand DNA-binding protein
MQDTQITIVGKLVDDPELRFTPARPARGQVPHRINPPATGTARPASGGTETRCSSAASCGARPPRTSPRAWLRGCGRSSPGRLRQRAYETKEGEKRTVYEVEVDELGPSLRSASAKVTKVARNKPTADGARGGQGDADPWASEASGGYSDEPPF